MDAEDAGAASLSSKLILGLAGVVDADLVDVEAAPVPVDAKEANEGWEANMLFDEKVFSPGVDCGPTAFWCEEGTGIETGVEATAEVERAVEAEGAVAAAIESSKRRCSGGPHVSRGSNIWNGAEFI